MTDRKQNRFNAVAILFSFGIIFLICIICGIQKHYAVAITDAWQLGYDTGLAAERPIREQMMSIQRQLGLKKIDGKIGPETTPAVNAAVKEEEKELCNQFAVECFEGKTK